MKLFLWPGDFVASLTGLPKDSDNRLVLRMYANVLIWGILSAIILAMVLT
ncbi:MAG: hypothetical protein KDC18_05320 [Alphaproteobacteria bacterium]|nr:hypothetical protein [Alphaproteobacteria bacterium]MCB9929171.1 hypothetical protein [Alphaproteobacteria bacterium]